MVVQECDTQKELKSNDEVTNKTRFYTEQKSMGDNQMSQQERIYRTYVQVVHFCENPQTFSGASYLAPPTSIPSSPIVRWGHSTPDREYE